METVARASSQCGLWPGQVSGRSIISSETGGEADIKVTQNRRTFAKEREVGKRGCHRQKGRRACNVPEEKDNKHQQEM